MAIEIWLARPVLTTRWSLSHFGTGKAHTLPSQKRHSFNSPAAFPAAVRTEPLSPLTTRD